MINWAFHSDIFGIPISGHITFDHFTASLWINARHSSIVNNLSSAGFPLCEYVNSPTRRNGRNNMSYNGSSNYKSLKSFALSGDASTRMTTQIVIIILDIHIEPNVFC